MKISKKILLSGINGNIGLELFSKLEQQFSIISIDHRDGKIKKNYTKLDLTDINSVNHYVENCDQFDTLIFLVGLAHA